jgi:hypothetical protein
METSHIMEPKPLRSAWLYILGGLAYVAYFILHGKIGPQEFFPEVTVWRVTSALEKTICLVGFTFAFVGSLRATARACGQSPAVQIVLGALAFPFLLAAIVVLPNAPHWFIRTFFYASVFATAALFIADIRARQAARNAGS